MKGSGIRTSFVPLNTHVPWEIPFRCFLQSKQASKQKEQNRKRNSIHSSVHMLGYVRYVSFDMWAANSSTSTKTKHRRLAHVVVAVSSLWNNRKAQSMGIVFRRDVAAVFVGKRNIDFLQNIVLLYFVFPAGWKEHYVNVIICCRSYHNNIELKNGNCYFHLLIFLMLKLGFVVLFIKKRRLNKNVEYLLLLLL